MKKLVSLLLCGTLAFGLTACSQPAAPSGEPTTSPVPDVTPVPEASPSILFRAGTYTATAEGRNGPLTLTMTLSDSGITSAEVTAHSETAGIADPALEKLPLSIVDAQSLDVSAVSGATVTSEAILAAAAECVRQAGVDPASLSSTVGASYEKNLTPGAYQATRHGHHSDVTVEVQVSQSAIESVAVLASGETLHIGDAATGALPAQIVETQSVGVDVITGATYTSRALLGAVEDCLEQAGGPLLVGADHVSDHVVYRVVQPAGGIGAGEQVLPFGPGNGKRLLDRLLRPPRIGCLGVPGQKGLGVPDQFAVMGAEQGFYLPGNELHFGCGHGGTLLFFLLP